MSTDFLRAVVDGLGRSPATLDCRFLYDDEGTRLFDAICGLPEYYVTRVETEILKQSAASVRDRVGDATLFELGSGLSIKTRILLDAWAPPLRYVSVDVSEAALREAEETLTKRHPGLEFRGMRGTYEQVFPLLSSVSPALVLFLGSTLGNLDPTKTAAFLEGLSKALSPGDYLLLGVDLVKDPQVLHDAYNDSAGVTAAFTVNVFARMNRDLGANLDLEALEHQSTWNSELEQMETDVVFLKEMDVSLPSAGFFRHFSTGDRVRVEISRKFRIENLRAELRGHGLLVTDVFTDSRGWCALLLAHKV